MKLPLHMGTCCSVFQVHTKFGVDICLVSLRYDFTSCLADFLLNLSGCTGQTVVRIKIIFNNLLRLGLKIISGDFEEDLTKIVGGVGFQRFLRKVEIAENLHNRKFTPLNVEFVLIQGDRKSTRLNSSHT